MHGQLAVRLAAISLGLFAALMVGCAGYPRIEQSFEFFAPARPEDPFYPKIADWQQRASREPVDVEIPGSVASEEVDPDEAPFGLLSLKFDAFLNRHKRALARDFTAWSQRQARLHFKPEPNTTLSNDHWPTLREFFESNGDDCDGLDLIAYGLLRRAGFTPDETFRMVVRRQRDGANHMVTLWFEDRDDPWVIDATGAMTIEMRRFSDLPPGWLPRMMFNENEMFNVVERDVQRVELAGDPDRNTEKPR